MAWTEAIYVEFPDEATARAMAEGLGVEFPASGRIPNGSSNYALHAPMQPPWVTPPVYDGEGELVTPGVAESGYWAMLRLNEEWAGCAATLAAIEGAGVRRELVDPPAVWA